MFDIIIFILLASLFIIPLIYLYISSRKARKENYENELSKKIVYYFKCNDTKPLTEMIDYHKKIKNAIKYKID
ncbi:MAG: hypothetical protein IJ809_03075 [Clostridia bacterium]|nr:hypothetical protein [Clostridia bacterium]